MSTSIPYFPRSFGAFWRNSCQHNGLAKIPESDLKSLDGNVVWVRSPTARTITQIFYSEMHICTFPSCELTTLGCLERQRRVREFSPPFIDYQ